MMRFKQRQGFSLVEMIVSLAILSIIGVLVLEVGAHLQLQERQQGEIAALDLAISDLMAGRETEHAEAGVLVPPLDAWRYHREQQIVEVDGEDALVQHTLVLTHSKTGETHRFVELKVDADET